MTPPTSGKKVVILGGGVGAMATAFELTNQPDWRTRFESITVYQLGWRLGGKGASGRGVNGRIEEHGLHVWLGFYNNAFRVMQAAYKELGRPPGAPLATWDAAFKKHGYVVVEDQAQDGTWSPWPFEFEDNAGVPGEGGDYPSLWDYVTEVINWLRDHLSKTPYAARPHNSDILGDIVHDFQVPLIPLDHPGGAAYLATMHQLASQLPSDVEQHPDAHHHVILELLAEFRGWFHGQARPDPATWADHEESRLRIVMSLGLALVRGLMWDIVLKGARSLDVLDGEDFRAWLARHGASSEACQSAPVRGLYDLVFAYRDGDPARPAFAAGVALRSVLRICLGYKGAIFWKMQAGMGDVVFGPLHDVLVKRGVTIKFFHRVKALHLDPADPSTIGSVTLGRQVTLKDPSAGYDPMTDVRGLRSWPASPRYELIADDEVGPLQDLAAKGLSLESFWCPWPDREEITLQAGRDFDALVFGISLGSVPALCQELLDASERWRTMVQEVQTVRTQAFQLWLAPTIAALGWGLPSPVLDGYVEPFDTWADMSQLIPRESWPTDPGSIAYFCGAMSGGIPPAGDTGAPLREWARTKAAALAWTQANIGRLWPQAVRGGGFDWDLLLAPHEGSGLTRFDAQFFRANIDPSERYVLSLPGSTDHRLAPDGSGFRNLYLAGDWTRNGFNAGCVEAAVMSALQVARAVIERTAGVEAANAVVVHDEDHI